MCFVIQPRIVQLSQTAATLTPPYDGRNKAGSWTACRSSVEATNGFSSVGDVGIGVFTGMLCVNEATSDLLWCPSELALRGSRSSPLLLELLLLRLMCSVCIVE